MQDSIFTKIIRGEILCEKVYEDDATFAFLDIHPIQPGHTLVVPKLQIANFEDMDDETYQKLFSSVKKVAQRIKEVLNPAKVCLRIEGFDVAHVHVHVYPCNNAQEFYGARDRLQKEPDHPALAELAKKLAF
ncbi:MAG TPA: HIT family protein [Patescibacteria group bacterium]|nr:HIT family protein [Patescibacteria group bacterium]